jgi:hypothetical protein
MLMRLLPANRNWSNSIESGLGDQRGGSVWGRTRVGPDSRQAARDTASASIHGSGLFACTLLAARWALDSISSLNLELCDPVTGRHTCDTGNMSHELPADPVPSSLRRGERRQRHPEPDLASSARGQAPAMHFKTWANSYYHHQQHGRQLEHSAARAASVASRASSSPSALRRAATRPTTAHHVQRASRAGTGLRRTTSSGDTFRAQMQIGSNALARAALGVPC